MTEPSREEALLNYAREKVEEDKRANGNGGKQGAGPDWKKSAMTGKQGKTALLGNLSNDNSLCATMQRYATCWPTTKCYARRS